MAVYDPNEVHIDKAISGGKSAKPVKKTVKKVTKKKSK